jgi:hypothetical protein
MSQYAGQLMATGAQAQTYADHFIAVHLVKIGGGKTYSQLATASLAQPKNTALAGQVQTIFRGETLRGLLPDDENRPVGEMDDLVRGTPENEADQVTPPS